MKSTLYILLILGLFSQKLFSQDDYLSKESFTLPTEDAPHEGTWLQWPHHHQYGLEYTVRLDPTWVAITKALAPEEKVHIIAYDEVEKLRITLLLENASVQLRNIDFQIIKTDDVWIRDSGPIYVRDELDCIISIDFGFNGWGEKSKRHSSDSVQYKYCDSVPAKIGIIKEKRVIDLNTIITNEGGSFDIDGYGTLMACKSSILNENRNPDLPIEVCEFIFEKYFGVSNFIWLDGKMNLNIRDQHIDDFARFIDSTTIITMKQHNLKAFKVSPKDINVLYRSRNKDGVGYTFVFVPLTKRKVKNTAGKSLGRKGSYLNYYIGNKVVLVPNYNDKNDDLANKIIQSLFPSRKVIGIDARNLNINGGMIHGVTQQQPAE